MREICIVGNSHVAALKMGLDHRLTEGSLPNCRFSIFGARARKLKKAGVRDGVLVANPQKPQQTFDHQSGPHEHLRLDAFDEIYFTVGTRPDEFPHFNPWFVLNYVGEQHQDLRPISQPTISAIVQHTLNGQWFSKLINEILTKSKRPTLYYLGSPLWSTEDPRCHNILEHLDADPSATKSAVLSKLQQGIKNEIRSRETTRFRLPPPPQKLLEPNKIATLHQYSVGSVRLSSDFETKHKAKDYRHMNAEYGRAIIDWIIESPSAVSDVNAH